MLIIRRICREEWEAAGPEDRSRILVGLAYCHLAACDEPLARENFEAAFATAPEHPGTMASMALAHLLRGNRAAAFDLARTALLADPTCEQAAVVLPQAAPADLGLAEVEALVPGRFLDIPAVLRGLAQAATDRGQRDAAVHHAERAHVRDPGEWRSGAQLGGKLLALIADDDESLGLTRMVEVAPISWTVCGLGSYVSTSAVCMLAS